MVNVKFVMDYVDELVISYCVGDDVDFVVIVEKKILVRLVFVGWYIFGKFIFDVGRSYDWSC